MKEEGIIIVPHQGMPPIRFGMSTDEVMRFIGEPVETELLEEDDEFFTPTLIWHFPDSGLSFFFEGDEHLLSSIESDNRETSLFGQKVFSLNAKQIEELMQLNGFEDKESEAEPWGEDRLSYHDALIDFYFVEGELSTIDWGIIPEG